MVYCNYSVPYARCPVLSARQLNTVTSETRKRERERERERERFRRQSQ